MERMQQGYGSKFGGGPTRQARMGGGLGGGGDTCVWGQWATYAVHA